MSKDTILRQWMAAATTEEQTRLAHAAGTTRAYLYHLAAPPGTSYHREPDPILAAKLEAESLAMHAETRGRLPRVYRTDLVRACALCSFARKCLGPAAVRSDFPVVVESEGGGHAD